MKQRRIVKIYKPFILVVVFLFAVIIARLCYIVLSKEVDGIDIALFASNRNTFKEKIVAERGTIYDGLGNTLAVNVNSYTVIAYLAESRTTDPSNPQHVVDKAATAKALSPIINMTEEAIMNLLNTENVYQVELGPGGRGLTELVKETIENLNLPGIDFIKSVKRYYPNNDFLSNTIGYAKSLEDSTIVGEMGIELSFNDELTGIDGYREYEGDVYGYKIAGTNECIEQAVNGKDIYLTIDTNIEMFTEKAINTLEKSSLEWATIAVVDAKTGAIVAVSSNPSFDPNIKNIKSYYDPFTSYTYEPGSTMKIFSFLDAIESGVYDSKDTYLSGMIQVGNYKIYDWNNEGWGTITYEQGFIGSSNVAATLLSQKLGATSLKDFYTKAGFGSKVDIGLPTEEGILKLGGEVETANQSFGQGMTVTALQMVQALTAIANDGVVLKPYIIEKIVEDGETVYSSQREEVSKIASKESIDTIKDLMYKAVYADEVMISAASYRTEKVTIMGKTGTAQIASPEGGYLEGNINYVRSFAGLFPKDDPQYIVYAVVSKLADTTLLPTAVKTLIDDISTYKGIIENNANEIANSYVINSYINKNVNEVKESLQNKNIDIIVIGEGDTVINQYPKSGIINSNDKLMLLTNSETYKYTDINGWSKSNITQYGKLLKVNFTFNGYGYATNIDINNRTVIQGETIEVSLKTKYEEEIVTESDT